MTPLAHRITKELTLPIKDRTFVDKCGLLKRMDDIHCFDVTQVLPLIKEMCLAHPEGGLPEDLAFLPAPKTWIEYKTADGGRHGYLLSSSKNGGVVYWQASSGLDGSWGGFAHESRLENAHCANEFSERFAAACVEGEAGPWFLLACLVLINTPRIFGRRQHTPHRGLERQLLANQKLIGKFPLHAWTEIILECREPEDWSDGPDHEAHYTGEKCMHFVRKHRRRLWNGESILIEGHWRGNPALGIKLSRYVLAA